MHNRQLTKVRPFANAVPTDSHRFMRSLSKTAAQFSDDSTLHGLRNVMNSLRAPNRTRCAKQKYFTYYKLYK